MTTQDKDILVIILEKDKITKLIKNFVINNHKINDENTSIQEEIPLTVRERKVLQLITQGKNNTKIAEVLNISIHTVKADVCSILQKLNVSDRLKAAVKAVKENLI